MWGVVVLRTRFAILFNEMYISFYQKSMKLQKK